MFALLVILHISFPTVAKLLRAINCCLSLQLQNFKKNENLTTGVFALFCMVQVLKTVFKEKVDFWEEVKNNL